MSDLQLSLLALGAVIIAAVILFNWWQERRFMRESMHRFEEPTNDILMADDFQIDPDRLVAFESESLTIEDRFSEERYTPQEHHIPDDALLEELHPGRPAEETFEPPKTAFRPEPPVRPEPPRRAPPSEPAVMQEPPVAPQPVMPPAFSEVVPEEPPFPPFEEEQYEEAADFVYEPEPEPIPEPEPEPEAAPVRVEARPPEPQAPPTIQPETHQAAAPEHAPAAGAVVSSMPDEVDEQIDLIGKAALPASLDTAAFLSAVQQMPRFDKPVQWLLQDEIGFWQPLSADLASGCYPQFVAALQLADRSGPVSQGGLLAFQEQVQRLASALGGRLAWHGAMDPLQYAIDLDQFCIDVDVMVGFHVLQGNSGPFSGAKLRGLAESGGMRLREDGAFHFEDENGRTLYTMTSQDQRPFKPETLRTVFYRGVSFQLDVPKVSSTSDAFNRMVQFARQLEASVDGILVDDNQRALGEIEIEKIRQQLKTIHTRMVARFILPGTSSALRLFS
jgi:FtsZ-interacting cell division protein ZipA